MLNKNDLYVKWGIEIYIKGKNAENSVIGKALLNTESLNIVMDTCNCINTALLRLYYP